MSAHNSLEQHGGGAGWQQHARLLTLYTPAGPDVLLAETARIEEALGPISEHAGFRIELTVLSVNAHQSFTALQGQPARLDLQTSASRKNLRPFHGHVTQVARLGANGGFARYRLVIEPWLSCLGHNRDSYLFQDKSVIEIVDELLGDWKGLGKLVPTWRWDLSDTVAYPKRSMTVQYQESDLSFLKRLLVEEGLFCWFEHQEAAGASLGSHTLILADHNGAFKENIQPRLRYTQAGATLHEDSLDYWLGLRQIDTAETNSASWDCRSLSTRPQSDVSAITQGPVPHTAAWHDPGQYAWPNNTHGARMQKCYQEAIDARMKQYQGEGTVRSAAPGTTFTLVDHPECDRDVAGARGFLIATVIHHARNNLGETIPELSYVESDPELPLTKAVDFYRCRLNSIRAATPWRSLLVDAHGRHTHPRPTVQGILSGIVVGTSAPTHTDRDLRIRVQFPWQRGAQSASCLTHPSGNNNAPASDVLGVWLRVITPVAGGNWGGLLIPRPGQEVLVAFRNGNIDRPVVIGAVYNGQGSADAQGNRVGCGTMQSSPNAPAFFAGNSGEHAHGASLSGFKSQQLDSTRSGSGGYNQLVFDDTSGEARIELATTEYQSRLQLGHLKQQSANARQGDLGHGAELATRASTALRAGSGLLLSADARSRADGSHLDSREPISQTEIAQNLSQSLADLAKKQYAALKGEPAADQLPAITALKQAIETMSATDSFCAATDSGGALQSPTFIATGGGLGSVPAWSKPRIQYAAPGGIAQLTPVNVFLVASQHLSIASGQDINLVAQGHHSLAVKNGLVLFSVGKANSKNKPNTETGIHLHAASGAVSLQSQSGKTLAAADKRVTFASTKASLTASAKGHLLATAKGAYLKIEGGDIQLHAPGMVEFKSSVKTLTGPRLVTVNTSTGVVLISEVIKPKDKVPYFSFSG